MNQYLKFAVYTMGTRNQCDFMAQLGGMSEDEKTVFTMLHDGRNEVEIQDKLHLSKSAYDLIEERVRKKVLIAVFDCINFRMQYLDKL